MQREILSGARIILADRTIEGSVVIEDGRIAEVLPDRFFREGLDLEGRFLAPGIIDIHTDYIEKEVHPRPTAEFPLELAFHFMDLRAIGCGVTTVLCAARISPDNTGVTGTWHGNGMRMAKAYEVLRRTALARHYIHLRWNPNFEPVDEVLDELLALECVGNLVYNDSTPGQRQFRDMEMLLQRFASRQNLTIEQARADFERRIERAKAFNNRGAVQAKVAGRIPLGSHDDTTVEHVLEAHRYGASLAEMPCSIEAARKAKELGMMVCMGAPNYYRGGSHCGNLGCPEALAENLVDILCSDFHFPSLLASAVKMMDAGTPAEDAFRLITLNPARHLGMDRDLGSIEAGKKADLIVFEPRRSFATVSHVWVDGRLRLRVDAPQAPPPDLASPGEEDEESEPVASR